MGAVTPPRSLAQPPTAVLVSTGVVSTSHRKTICTPASDAKVDRKGRPLYQQESALLENDFNMLEQYGKYIKELDTKKAYAVKALKHFKSGLTDTAEVGDAAGTTRAGAGAKAAGGGGDAFKKGGAKGAWRVISGTAQGGTRPAAKQAGVWLHKALREKDWGEVIHLVRAAPKAATEPAAVDLRRGGDMARQWGAVLPLHHALLRCAPFDAVRALVAADQDAVRERSKQPQFEVPEGFEALGELPLHLALWAGCTDDVIELLVDVYKPTTREQAGGLKKVHGGIVKGDGHHDLALHVMLRSSRRTLRAFNAIVRCYDKVLSQPGDDGAYPLHLAVSNEAYPCNPDGSTPSEDVDIALECTKLRPAVASLDGTGDYAGKPIHIACRVSRSPQVIEQLLNVDPNLSKERDAFGDLPLHNCLRRFRDIDNPHGAAESVCLKLIHSFPGSAKPLERSSDGQCSAVLASCHQGASFKLLDKILQISPDSAFQLKKLKHFEGLDEILKAKVLAITDGKR